MSFKDPYKEFIYKRTYARFLDKEGRREDWSETINRYKEFFSEKVPSTHASAYEAAINEIVDFNVMPSMRALWTAGEALKRENIAGYNCAYVTIDRIKAFPEILYILMNGCFHKDTLIKTSHGNKKISELTVDDFVLSYNFEKNEYEFVKPLCIVPTSDSIKKKKIELEFEDGTIVKCTEDHEFYTINRGWIKAKDLTEEDDIKNYNEI